MIVLPTEVIGRMLERLLVFGVVWLEALESTTQSLIEGGGVIAMILNELARDY
jgi:hypothetical protein